MEMESGQLPPNHSMRGRGRGRRRNYGHVQEESSPTVRFALVGTSTEEKEPPPQSYDDSVMAGMLCMTFRTTCGVMVKVVEVHPVVKEFGRDQTYPIISALDWLTIMHWLLRQLNTARS